MPGSPVRAHLLAAVVTFVLAARDLEGIAGVALLGSLATDTPDPHDADLASLARRLQGRAQQRNAGADVFLATPRGRYLGRTCPWRECRPGLRLRCDARHCGRRPYLHDDLQTIRLAATLLAAPPIELWPRVAVRAGPDGCRGDAAGAAAPRPPQAFGRRVAGFSRLSSVKGRSGPHQQSRLSRAVCRDRSCCGRLWVAPRRAHQVVPGAFACARPSCAARVLRAATGEE